MRGFSSITRRVITFYFVLILTAIASAAAEPKAATGSQECNSLLTEAIPVQWIQKMIAEGRAAEPQTQRLRDVVQRLGFGSAALNQEILRNHRDLYTTELA